MYMEARWEGGSGRTVKVGVLAQSLYMMFTTILFIKCSKTEEKSVAPGSSGIWWGVRRIDLGEEIGWGHSNSAQRKWNNHQACARFLRPAQHRPVWSSRGLFFNMQEQTNDPWRQEAAELLFAQTAHSAAVVWSRGNEWEFSPCCPRHSPGWLIDSSPAKPEFLLEAGPLGAHLPLQNCSKKMYCLPLSLPSPAAAGLLEGILPRLGYKSERLWLVWLKEKCTVFGGFREATLERWVWKIPALTRLGAALSSPPFWCPCSLRGFLPTFLNPIPRCDSCSGSLESWGRWWGLSLSRTEIFSLRKANWAVGAGFMRRPSGTKSSRKARSIDKSAVWKISVAFQNIKVDLLAKATFELKFLGAC